jgi:hypothetical protein
MIGFSLHIQQLLHRNLGLSPQRYYHRVAPNSSGQGGKVGKYRGQMTNLPLLRPRFAYQAYHELEQPCIKKQILRVSILWTWHLPTCLLAMLPLLPAGETPAMAFQRNFHRKPWDCGTTSHAFLQFVFPKSMKCGYCNLNISQSHPMSHSPSTPINSSLPNPMKSPFVDGQTMLNHHLYHCNQHWPDSQDTSLPDPVQLLRAAAHDATGARRHSSVYQ